MKKIVSTLMIVVVLFNFILVNRAYADSVIDMSDDDGGVEDALNGEMMEGLMNTGKVIVNKAANPIGFQWDIIGAVVSLLARFLNLFPMLTRQVMMMCTTGSIWRRIFYN